MFTLNMTLCAFQQPFSTRQSAEAWPSSTSPWLMLLALNTSARIQRYAIECHLLAVIEIPDAMEAFSPSLPAAGRKGWLT